MSPALLAVRTLDRLDTLVGQKQAATDIAPFAQPLLLQPYRLLGFEVSHHQAASKNRPVGKIRA